MSPATSIPKKKLLFILDLNGTLLHRITRSSAQLLADSHPNRRLHNCKVNGNSLYYRPGLWPLLASLFSLGEVAVWTSAMPKNAHPMVLNIFDGLLDKATVAQYSRLAHSPFQFGPHQLLFLWTQEECQVQRIAGIEKPEFKKDLERVWKAFPAYSPANTIMIDDSPLKLSTHLGNLIAIKEFLVTEPDVDHTADNVLCQLQNYLERHFSEPPPSVQTVLKETPFIIDEADVIGNSKSPSLDKEIEALASKFVTATI